MQTNYKEQINKLRAKLLKLWPTGDDVLKEEAWEAWENSLYMRALDLLEDINSQFIRKTADGVQMAFITLDPAGNIIDRDDGEYIQPQYKEPKRLTIGKETKFNPEAENITAKEQAVIYYFISNPAEDPNSQDNFTTDQLLELLNAFIELDNYYYEISDHNEKAINITAEFYNFIKYREDHKSNIDDLTSATELLQSLKPKNYKIPNNKLMNALQTDQLINDPRDLQVFDKKNKDITAYVFATYNDKETGIKLINNNLTQYQTDVSNAVITIWKQAQEEKKPPVFSIDMIYKYMPGGGERPSDKARAEIKKSLDILSNLKIELDATEEMQKRGKINYGDKFTIEENYFNLRKATHKIKNGGQEVEAYQILSTPLIWNYAEMTNQILTIPRKYLTVTKIKNGKITNEVIQMNEARQSITSCILKRIEIIKHDRKNKTKTQSDIIRLDYIYRMANIEDLNKPEKKTERKRINDFIIQVMDYQTAAGNIKGYERKMNGRQFAALKIIL